MYTVAIVDDNNQFQSQLKEFINRYSVEKNLQIDVKTFSNGMSFLLDFTGQYSVIFLDIEMPTMDGMEVARCIRKSDEDSKIVFITRMANYAIKGYEVNALDFIVKPLSYHDFTFKFDRCLKLIQSKEKKVYLYIKNGDSIEKVDIDDISFIEVYNHTLIYHLLDRNIETRGSLKSVEEQLIDTSFIKCSNSHIVNSDKIVKIKSDTIEMKSGDVLPLTRGKKKEFMKNFIQRE